jgi:hypothetical protein
MSIPTVFRVLLTIFLALELIVPERDLKEKANDTLEDIKSSASTALLKAGLENLGDDKEKQSTFKKLKYGLVIGGFGLIALFLMLSFMGLMKWLFGFALVAGLGAGAWFWLKPKVTAFREAARRKLLAGQEEREREEAELRKVEETKQKAQAIDDELEALRQKTLDE